MTPSTSFQRVLTVDIGGSGTKMMVWDPEGHPVTERYREKTPLPASPEYLVPLIARMAETQRPFDRVSVGFPGVISQGVVRTAVNLGQDAWAGFPLQEVLQEQLATPTLVMNDADLQGFGVIEGRGLELVLTLGTGLGSALFVDGHLVPNLELAHHPWQEGKTYEQLVGKASLDKGGKKRWRKFVGKMIEQIAPIWNYDTLHLGGGNLKHLDEGDVPATVRIFDNVAGMSGGVRVWHLRERS